MFIVDGHLDLSYNALRWRDVLLPAARQSADEEGIPTVGLPDLRAGKSAWFSRRSSACRRLGMLGHRSTDDAAAAGRCTWSGTSGSGIPGFFGLSWSAADIQLEAADESPMPMLLLLEGADPIRDPSEVAWWFEQGLRAVGLAWKRTRFAGGTGRRGR